MAESEQQVIDPTEVADISSVLGEADTVSTETTGSGTTATPTEETASDETVTTGAETAGTATTATEEATMTETTATSQTATADAEELVDIETLAKDLPRWKLAGIMRHNRWAPGKALSQSDFDAAVAAFEGRPLGGGR